MKRILVTGLSTNIGGIGALLTNLVSYNQFVGNSEKFIFDFIVPYNSEYINYLKKENYVYYEVPPLNNIFIYIRILIRIFKSNRYDFVWINNTSKVDIFFPIISKYIGKAKIVQHSHGVDCEEKGLKRSIFKFCEFIWGRLYECLIDIPMACSDLSANYFYKNKDLRRECLILHNGIFPEKFKYNELARNSVRKLLGIESECTILLGAVGRLTKVKNYTFLIDLINHLPENFNCIIVGDGEEEDLLKDMIRDKNLANRVQLLGKRNDIPDLLSAMDCYLMPSLNEGLPFSIIEAQASGLYCIASKGVSQEANLFGNVTFLDLSIELWSHKCCNYNLSKIDREICKEMVSKAGYNIEYSYDNFIRAIS